MLAHLIFDGCVSTIHIVFCCVVWKCRQPCRLYLHTYRRPHITQSQSLSTSWLIIRIVTSLSLSFTIRGHSQFGRCILAFFPTPWFGLHALLRGFLVRWAPEFWLICQPKLKVCIIIHTFHCPHQQELPKVFVCMSKNRKIVSSGTNLFAGLKSLQNAVFWDVFKFGSGFLCSFELIVNLRHGRSPA